MTLSSWLLTFEHRVSSQKDWVNDAWVVPVLAPNYLSFRPGMDLEQVAEQITLPMAAYHGYRPSLVRLAGAEIVTAESPRPSLLRELYIGWAEQEGMWIEEALSVHQGRIAPYGAESGDLSADWQSLLSLGFAPAEIAPGKLAVIDKEIVAVRVADGASFASETSPGVLVLGARPDSAQGPWDQELPSALRDVLPARLQKTVSESPRRVVLSHLWSDVIAHVIERPREPRGWWKSLDRSPPRRVMMPEGISFPEGWAGQKS